MMSLLPTVSGAAQIKHKDGTTLLILLHSPKQCPLGLLKLVLKL